MNDAVQYECRGNIAYVTLNRPDQINAVNDAVRTGLVRALARAEGESDVRVIILSGAGQRGFCAGADIKESRGAETAVEARRRMLDNTHFDALEHATKPVIAAIHGICLGGGFEIALACDIRIASPDAVFAFPETGLGIIPGGGGTQRLSRSVGLGRALDLILTGDRIDGQEALRIGAISRLVADREKLLAEAEAVALRIAAKPPTATAYAKESARRGLEVDLESGLRLEKTLFAMLLTTEDRLEAASAFKEKRKPLFTGR